MTDPALFGLLSGIPSGLHDVLRLRLCRRWCSRLLEFGGALIPGWFVGPYHLRICVFANYICVLVAHGPGSCHRAAVPIALRVVVALKEESPLYLLRMKIPLLM